MIECVICKGILTKASKIIAFDEIDPNDLDWDYAKEFDEFDEIIPMSNAWTLVHYYCLFKEKSS